MIDVIVENASLVLVEASNGGVLLERQERAAELVTEGQQGPPGPPGPAGADGPAGAAGLRVVGSAANEAELPLSAATGDVWVTLDTGHGYAWTGSMWVDIGPIAIPGPAGVPGKKGNIQHVGTGAPGVILGAEPGDTYLDLSTGTVYTLS